MCVFIRVRLCVCPQGCVCVIDVYVMDVCACVYVLCCTCMSMHMWCAVHVILSRHDQLLKKLSEMGSSSVVVTEGQEAEFKVSKVRTSAAVADADDLNSESDAEEDGEGSPLGKVEESQSVGHRYVNPFFTFPATGHH